MFLFYGGADEARRCVIEVEVDLLAARHPAAYGVCALCCKAKVERIVSHLLNLRDGLAMTGAKIFEECFDAIVDKSPRFSP